MDILVRRGLRNVPNPEYRDKFILLVDVTHAGSQAQVHMRVGSADHDGSAASTSEACKRQHYARPKHVSLDERAHKLNTFFAVESFVRLGVEGSYFIDQLAEMERRWRGRGCKRNDSLLLQIVTVTTQVTISRTVSRFKLQLRDRQNARRSQGGRDDRPTPMAWLGKVSGSVPNVRPT